MDRPLSHPKSTLSMWDAIFEARREPLPLPPLPKRRRAIPVRTDLGTSVELKYIDQSYATAAISNSIAGAFANPLTEGALNSIALGDGESDRDGRKVLLKSIHIRGAMYRLTETSIGSDLVARLIVFLDTQTNGAEAAPELLINTGAVHPEYAYRNMQQTKRFKVLKDGIFVLSQNAAAGGNTTVVSGPGATLFDWNFNVHIPVIYSGATEVIASIVDNSIQVYCMASGNDCTLRYESRIRFVG